MADDVAGLIAARTPLIDVRAPIEFERGAVPGAVNLPILENDERAHVGTTYKSRGREAAIALGHDLVATEDRRHRVAAWQSFAASVDNVHIYCARGGLRSKIAQEWLADAGVVVPRVAGGFKKLRRACLKALEEHSARLTPIVLGGRTGTGKTRIINRHRCVDLEALANHRGSAFGGYGTPQPTTIDFENALAYELIGIEDRFLVEDESKRIGRLSIPEPFFAVMRRAPVVVVEADLDQRVANIRQEYVEAGPAAPIVMRQALQRIQRRLGLERHAEIDALMEHAYESGESRDHDAWIERLLIDYYDPMYTHQLEEKADRIVFRGVESAVDDFVETLLRDESPHLSRDL